MPEFYDICPQYNKISEFCLIFARKMPEFYMIIARKTFSRFFEGMGARAPAPPPVSYTYSMHRCNESRGLVVTFCSSNDASRGWGSIHFHRSMILMSALKLNIWFSRGSAVTDLTWFCSSFNCSSSQNGPRSLRVYNIYSPSSSGAVTLVECHQTVKYS